MRSGVLVVAAAAVVAVVGLTGCGGSASPGSGGTAGERASGPLLVVAGENFWGSLATELGGSHVRVTSIINNPDADPHDHEPTAADARALAAADVVLINGVGYDPWMTKLVAANPAPHRAVLTVGDLVGVAEGGNPHLWYDPDDVTRVADRLTADFKRADPADAAAFDAQRSAFGTTGLAAYQAVIAEIRARYAGVPVGASESIFAMVAPALGLELLTPQAFLKAISEGTDPSAADKATVDAQISGRKIKVYVYNSQNATPDIQTQIAAAKAAGIPVTTITETMVPATGTWQQWQTAQLVSLRDALALATGH
jgi:zinc/manganese transport system substrate-binding protein